MKLPKICCGRIWFNRPKQWSVSKTGNETYREGEKLRLCHVERVLFLSINIQSALKINTSRCSGTELALLCTLQQLTLCPSCLWTLAEQFASTYNQAYQEQIFHTGLHGEMNWLTGLPALSLIYLHTHTQTTTPLFAACMHVLSITFSLAFFICHSSISCLLHPWVSVHLSMNSYHNDAHRWNNVLEKTCLQVKSYNKALEQDLISLFCIFCLCTPPILMVHTVHSWSMDPYGTNLLSVTAVICGVLLDECLLHLYLRDSTHIRAAF